MTSRLRRSLLPTALAVCAVLTACGGGDAPATPPPTVVAALFLPAADTVHLGEARRIVAQPKDAAGRLLSGRRILYASHSPEVATIDAAGTVTPIAEGATTIRATSEGVSAEMALVVRPTRVTAMRFPVAPPPELLLDDTLTLVPELTDRLGARVERPVAYASSHPTVASVDATGRVTALAVGAATITASIDGVSASYPVTVIHLARPATVVIHPASVALLAGASGQLWVKAANDTGGPIGRSRIRFASSDSSVAVVSPQGTVQAHAPGTALVTVEVNGHRATTTVNVEESAAGAFRIDFVFVGTLANDPAVQAKAREAAARWERVIVGALPAQVIDMDAGQCATGAPAVRTTTTGLVVVLQTDSLDPGIAGYGGPCAYRLDPYTSWDRLGAPALGSVLLGEAQVRAYVANNPAALVALITHEIGHVLGIGLRWGAWGQAGDGLRVGPESDYRFVGPAAIAASSDLGFSSPGESVPIENTGGGGTAGAHPRRSMYGSEVMTGWLSSGALLSGMTAGWLRDLGYVVQMAGADLATAARVNTGNYGGTLPAARGDANGRLARPAERPLELHGDVLRPRYVIGRDGRLRPIASP